MGNGFQVTILYSEALESWNLDWILIWPSILSYMIFSCLGLVSREKGHYKRPKLGNIHYNWLLGHYNFKLCDSVSQQMFDVVEQIFLKNMIGRGIISLSDVKWHLVSTNFVLFGAHFLKTAFKAISVKQGQMNTLHRAKLYCWNSCGQQCVKFLSFFSKRLDVRAIQIVWSMSNSE